MNYEEILRSLNGCGIYQLFLMVILSLTTMQGAIDMQLLLYMHYTPTYTCNDFEFTNSTRFTKIDECFAISNDFNSSSSTGLKIECTSWTFDKSVMQRTLVTEYNLVCSRAYITSINEMLLFVGVSISYIIGYLGDHYGRRKLIIIGAIWEICTSLSSALVENLYLILTLRLLRGFSKYIYSIALELLCELVPLEKRTIFGLNFWLLWTGGYLSCAGLAMLLGDWRTIRLYASIPQITYILFLFFLPESPRWLASKGKMKEAIDILKTIAKWNRRELTVTHFTEDSDKVKKGPLDKPLQLIVLPNMRKKLIAFSIILTTLSIGYNGLSLDSKFASDNLFHNALLLGLFELPTGFFSWFLCTFFRRRQSQLFCFLLAGFAMISAPFLRKYFSIQIIFTIVAILGKIGLTVAFCIGDLYVTEIFPTTLRNAGLFTVLIFSQLMCVIAPLINRLQNYYFFGSGLIYGLLCFLSAFLTWYALPETQNCPLPQTMEESEKLQRGNEKEWTKEVLANQIRDDSA